MSAISKERVKDILEFGAGRIISPITDDEIMELARIALASFEAEPVAYIIQDADARSRGEKGILRYFANISDEDINEYQITVTPLYTATPAPVAVPDDVTAEDCPAFIKYDLTEVDEAWARGFNACRAAMLQGADGNSPVIPDGWKLVPVELTGAMTNAMTDAILDDLHNVDVWRSVLAAAPQQEVKP